MLHKSHKENKGDASSHRYHTFIEGKLKRLLKGGSVCIRNFKDEGGPREFEKGMVILEKRSVLMSTVSSFQVMQRDWERSSVSKREGFEYREQSVLCEWRPAKGNRIGHIQGHYDQDDGLCRPGKGRIWPFIQQSPTVIDRILVS